MGVLLANVLPLAAGAAVSPTIFVVVVVLLSSGVRPVLRTAAFATGAAVPLLGIGVACLFVLGLAALRAHFGISALIDLGFGVALVVLAVRSLRGRRVRDHPEAIAVPGGSIKAAGLGMGMMVTNVTTLALFVPAVKDIANARTVSLTDRLVALALLLVITLAVVLVPLLLHAVAPACLPALLAPLSRVGGGRHGYLIRAALLAGFGSYLTIRGVIAL